MIHGHRKRAEFQKCLRFENPMIFMFFKCKDAHNLGRHFFGALTKNPSKYIQIVQTEPVPVSHCSNEITSAVIEMQTPGAHSGVDTTQGFPWDTLSYDSYTCQATVVSSPMIRDLFPSIISKKKRKKLEFCW